MRSIFIAMMFLFPQATLAVGPYFVSAGNVRASYSGSEQAIPLPPTYQEGDLLLFMGFTPEGSPAAPSGWTHACTYNYYKFAAADETPPIFRTNRGAIAGIIAAYRGVKKDIALPCVPEYGGLTLSPGTYYPPDGSSTPKFTPGLGPALTVTYSNSLRVMTYQSESSDSLPIQVHDSNSVDFAERAMGYDDWTSNCTDYFHLGFFDILYTGPGSTGLFYFGTTGSGGGHKSDVTCSYNGPVAWFSQILLPPATFTHASPPGGECTTQQEVTLSIEGSGTIYYSTDGTNPSTDSDIYSGPIIVSTETTIRYFGVSSEGLMEDAINSDVYTFPSGLWASFDIIKTGTGTGKVTSYPAGINCDSSVSSCGFARFPLNTRVSLFAVPSLDGSLFLGWSGDADCSDGVIMVSGSVSCNANFDLCTTGLPAQNENGPCSSIALAYSSAALTGDVIKVIASNREETLDFHSGKSISLIGGFNCSFESIASYTVVTGSLTVSGGDVTIENIVIR